MVFSTRLLEKAIAENWVTKSIFLYQLKKIKYSMMFDRLKSLVSLPFLVCLVLLIANDFYFKAVFHNTFTGKLSDFCGLFIFPIFWSALLPKRKLAIFILTGLLFIYWKSEYSSVFIEFFSTYFFTIGRVVDLTDLLALVVLPLAWFGVQFNIETVNFKFFRYANPYLVAVVTFFSFCATSQQRYIQSFDQPQYVLFEGVLPIDSAAYSSGFELYKFDSLLVVEVLDMFTTNRPVKDDDYDKNLGLKDLDKDIFNMLPGKKHLMHPGRVTSLVIKTPYYEDVVRFKGTRLDGKFIRKKGNRIIIQGFYENGIEDSIWIVHDTSSTLVTKKTFINGERTKIQEFKGDKLISSGSVNTRADTIRNKYIQIGILVVLLIGTIFLLVTNYRKVYPERLNMQPILKWLLCIILPLIVLITQSCIIILLGDYHFDIFEQIAAVFFIYVITFPLFLIIVFWIKLRKPIDILWYCLLFALAGTIFIEYNMLVALSAQT